ncbi:hypothetical protein JTB14_013377 [Gonioctena quinquepunctata]|nr:hypothetical protein JTB14_013377 [Gonioctena quinquepunctata]
MDNWMKTHVSQTMIIYDIPGIVAGALPRAANIMAGFRVSGICPFNGDDELFPPSVTERELPGPCSGSVADRSTSPEPAPSTSAANRFHSSPTPNASTSSVAGPDMNPVRSPSKNPEGDNSTTPVPYSTTRSDTPEDGDGSFRIAE